MPEQLSTSLALMGLWLAVGVAAWIVVRDRRARRAKERDIEARLAEWVEAERERGADLVDIAARLEGRRRELAAEYDARAR